MHQGIGRTNRRIEDKDLTLQSQDGVVPSLALFSDVSLEDALLPARVARRPTAAYQVFMSSSLGRKTDTWTFSVRKSFHADADLCL